MSPGARKRAERLNRTRPRRKLEAVHVREIRYLWYLGRRSQRQLAEKFGVSQPTVYHIVHYHTWRWVEPDLRS